VNQQYRTAWEEFKAKDRQTRLIISKIYRSASTGQTPYLLSREEIVKFNQAREAWFEFLRVARR